MYVPAGTLQVGSARGEVEIDDRLDLFAEATDRSRSRSTVHSLLVNMQTTSNTQN